jgi:hypothetical protein
VQNDHGHHGGVQVHSKEHIDNIGRAAGAQGNVEVGLTPGMIMWRDVPGVREQSSARDWSSSRVGTAAVLHRPKGVSMLCGTVLYCQAVPAAPICSDLSCKALLTDQHDVATVSRPLQCLLHHRCPCW